MQFGVQFFPIVGPDEKSARDYFAESLAVAEEADKLGYTHIRTVDHYFEPYGGYSPNPIVFLSAAAQRTKSARLVTGAVLPVFNNPLKLAGEIAMLDAISNGRVDIGFARAFLPHEFRRFGISPDESVSRYQEGLEQIELLLTRENATHKGKFHSFENITSLPRPTQQPRPKFYVAATQTAETFEFAARKGYSLMTIPIGQIKPLIALYRKVWKDSGHPGDGEVMIAFHMLCHEDGKRARDLARGPLEKYFSMISSTAKEWADGTTKSKDYRDYDKSMSKMRAATLDGQIEAGSAWIGTPAELRDQIGRYVAEYGDFEHASLQINFGTLDFAEAQRSMRLFASEVMPAFAAKRPPLAAAE
jgi:alkanesulfonate monooxygenase SsuD/methylene tetrahydromethanopterin reductase-like flavin-dependent oxidoreductase (luciferase family)